MTERLGLDHHLCFALYSASRAFTRAYGPILEPLGLTYPQYLVMLALWETDGRSVRELGEALALDSGTLTPLLKRLEGAGLLLRTRSTTDERMLRIELTAAGKKLEQRGRRVPLELMKQMGFEATDEAKQRLMKLRKALVTLTNRLEAAPLA